MAENRVLAGINVDGPSDSSCAVIRERIERLLSQLDSDELREFRARMHELAGTVRDSEAQEAEQLYDYELRCWELSTIVGRSDRWSEMLTRIVDDDDVCSGDDDRLKS